MGRRLSIAAKERWRKRKATAMEEEEASHNEEDQNIQRASLATQNEAEGPKHSALTNDNEQSKQSHSAAFISKRKVSEVNNMIVRRSNRRRSLGFFGKRQGKTVQHIDLADCDRDKALHVEPIRLKPIKDVNSSEMKVDYLVHTEADGPKNSALTNNKQSKLSQAFSSKGKTLKANNMTVGQAGQLKTLGKRQGKKGVHHVDPTNRDRDTELHVEPISPEPIRNMSISEMIVDRLIQTRGKRPFASETAPANLNYEILYTNSEKKIEALTEENCRQAQTLYYMLGKVNIYENMIGIVKDMVAFSNVGRPTGAVTDLSRGTVKHHPDAPALNSARSPKLSPAKRK